MRSSVAAASMARNASYSVTCSTGCNDIMSNPAIGSFEGASRMLSSRLMCRIASAGTPAAFFGCIIAPIPENSESQNTVISALPATTASNAAKNALPNVKPFFLGLRAAHCAGCLGCSATEASAFAGSATSSLVGCSFAATSASLSTFAVASCAGCSILFFVSSEYNLSLPSSILSIFFCFKPNL